MNPKSIKNSIKKGKFKVGQHVVISSRPYYSVDRDRTYLNPGGICDIGSKHIIAGAIDSDGDYEIKDEGEEISNVNESCLSLVKDYKHKQVKFLLKYDLDIDPIEEYESMEEVRTRIQYLLDNEDSSDKDSIVVYEIKSVHKVTISNKITISK
jgi:hypothetical protein